MREPKLSRKGKLFIRLMEKVAFSVLTTTLGLVAFFSAHPVIAFCMTVWACWEVHSALKAFFRYSEEPTIIIEPNKAPKDMKDIAEESITD